MIKIKNPKNGATVRLLTDSANEFLKTDRSNFDAADFDYLNLKYGASYDLSFPKQILFEVEGACGGRVQLSENDSFENPMEITFCGNSFEIENLKCGTNYFLRVIGDDEISETHWFFTEDSYPRFVKIDGLTNVRDCGGYKTSSGKRVKQGMLYRGSEMNSHVNITQDGLKTMKEVLKIKSVLDLRGKNEIVEDVYGGNYLNVSVSPYSEYFEQPEVTTKIFEFLCDESNYPIYFHCWGGADRTGTLAFLTGALLGYNYGDLINDYEVTSLSVWGVRSVNSRLWKEFEDKLNSFDGINIGEKVRNHLALCGVSPEMTEQFEKIMLL